MGIALAAAAARRGAEVTLIAANVSLPEPAGVRRIDVETAAELAEAARAEFPALPGPADGRRSGRLPAARRSSPESSSATTASSSASSRPRTSSPASPPPARRGQTIVGFAAETGEDARERAREKREPQGRRPDRPQRRLRPGDRVREREQRGHPDRRRGRGRGADLLQGGDRRRRSSTGSTRCVGRAQRAGYTEFELFCA